MKPVRDKWNKHTRIYHLGGGLYKAVISSNQNYFNASSNEWEEVDLRIEKKAKWEFKYAVERNNFAAFFNDATDRGNPTLASVDITNKNGDKRWINYKINNAAPKDVEINGNSIRYLNCWDGVDCEYVVTPDKLKFNIIYASRQSVRDIDITIKESEKIVRRMIPNGLILFFDTETNELLWKINAPFFVDKSIRGKTGERRIARYRMDKEVLDRGKAYQAISINIENDEWLDKAEYPVILDPTTDFTPPVKDACIFEHFPDQNPGEADDLGVINYYYGAVEDIQRVLIQFDMSALPANAVLYQSTLWLFWYMQMASVGDYIIHTIKRLTRSDWDETNVTWSSYKPGSAWTTPGGDFVETHEVHGGFSSAADEPNTWLGFYVDGIVGDVIDGGSRIVNFIIKSYHEKYNPEQPGNYKSTGYQFYRDSEHPDTSLRPTLEIIYKLAMEHNFSVNAAVVKRYNRNFSAASALKRAVQQTFTARGALAKTLTGNYSANAAVKKNNITSSLTAESVFNRQYIRSIGAEAVIRKIVTIPVIVSAVLRRIVQSQFACEANIIRTVNNCFSANSVLRKFDYTNLFRASAALRGENASIFFDNIYMDANVTKQLSFSLNVTRGVTWEVWTVT